MSKRVLSLICCLSLILAVAPMSVSAASLEPVAFSFTDGDMAALAATGAVFAPRDSAEGAIVKGVIDQDGDGAAYKGNHKEGTGYMATPNAIGLEFGTPLSGGVEWTISAWFYVPSEGNEGKSFSTETGPSILINDNSGSDWHKSIPANDGPEFEADTWINAVFKTSAENLGEDIDRIAFRFYTNDAATHPEVWYIDNISIKMTADAPEIMTAALGDGFVSVPYEKALVAGGNPPITWSVGSGDLPAGLTLTADGVLSGTPSAAGNYVFTLKAANEFGAGEMEYTMNIQQADTVFVLSEPAGKTIGSSNPLISHKYGADPWAMEYDGRLYVYTTADAYTYDASGNIVTNSYGDIKSIYVMSTDDMVNWTDHGAIPVTEIATWAGNSWAPCVAWKNIGGEDKVFLYFADSGRGVGVIVGDSPTGPWSDPIGKHLVNHNTPNCSSDLVPWCFDPSVFIDDDGAGYLYFGGGQGGDPVNPMFARMVRLQDNMVEIDGVPEAVDAPFFFEASAMHKYNGKYYFIYSTNFSTNQGDFDGERPGNADIAYIMGDAPMGPFTYMGVALPNQSAFGFGGGNNHPCMFSFKGEWYIAYHTQILYMERYDTANVRGYRSTNIDRISYRADGSIERITGTREGIPQLKTFDPYAKVEAETIAWSGGIATVMQDPSMESTANLYVTSIENGNWISVSQADLGSVSPQSFTARVAGKRGGVIELRAGSPDPDSAASVLLASMTVKAGNGEDWTTEAVNLSAEATGVQDLFLVFKGDANKAELFDLDWWQLSGDSVTPTTEEGTPSPGNETPAPGSVQDSETPPAEEPESGFPIIPVIVLVAVVAAGGVVAFILTRKKR